MAKKKSVKAASVGAADKTKAVLCSILSYFVIGIAWYFVDERMKRSSLAKRHANQALFLILASFVVYVALWIFAFLPFIGSILSYPLGVVAQFALLFLWLYGIVQALFAQDKPMLFVGKYAEQLNL
jgi:uncharacterized membrane protein